MSSEWMPLFVDSYDPLLAGSIDGTDTVPHDKGIQRAMYAKYKPNLSVTGEPQCTIFVGRLNPNTTEQTLQQYFSRCGPIKNVRIVRDIITGFSKCYGFIEYTDKSDARHAAIEMHQSEIDDFCVCVEMEKERSLSGWIPRRLGGGIGGKKESGQIRFGGVDRPFRRIIKVTNQRYNNGTNNNDRSRDSYRQTSYVPREQNDRGQSRNSYRSSERSRDRRSRSRERNHDRYRNSYR